MKIYATGKSAEGSAFPLNNVVFADDFKKDDNEHSVYLREAFDSSRWIAIIGNRTELRLLGQAFLDAAGPEVAPKPPFTIKQE